MALPWKIIKDQVALAFWLSLCVAMLLPFWPALPRSWVAYSWASLFQVMSLPAHIRGDGLVSMPRYALVGKRYPRAHRLTVALCIAWTIILTRLLAGPTFVA